MSDIYALQGRKECGKTATINRVFTMLQNKYRASNLQIQHLPPNISGEIKVIMTGIKGLVIGVASQGDPYPSFILDVTLNDFENAGCDIIFCACRTRGATVDCIKSHTKYTPHFIRQTIVPTARQAQSNINMAQNLIQMAGL
jgi:Cdc6-like AAA superfamily ATPase